MSGVMPEGFEFPTVHQFWLPLREDRTQVFARRGAPPSPFGRLAPGVTIEHAQAEIAAVTQSGCP
jgi:hypothetical protein